MTLPESIPQGLEDGRIRDLLALRDPRDFDIEPIAHRLAQLNRYCGALGWPLSVATHSIAVSYLCPEGFELSGLLHDITESFGIGDLVSPIKRILPGYNALESAIREQLVGAYPALRRAEEAPVRHADERAYQLECRYIRGAWPHHDQTIFDPTYPTDREHEIAMAYYSREISWQSAKQSFLIRYEELTSR